MTNRNTLFYINGQVFVRTSIGLVPLQEKNQIIHRQPSAKDRSRRLSLAERSKLLSHLRTQLPASSPSTQITDQ